MTPRSLASVSRLSALVTAIAPLLVSVARADTDPEWWALRPLGNVAPPPGADHPIDAFLSAELAAHGLTPVAPAAPEALLRRLTYDLTGLPPTPEELAAFVADRRPDAYERLVDRLLESPRCAERFARAWLDVVHFGETHGFDKDKPRPHAWPYRDFVIDAFQVDLPYREFIEKQLAADVLHPTDEAAIAALGFIAAGPWDFVGHVELREGTKDKRITRSLDRDDMVATTMTTFASVTVHCARCHDHKFDPITQDDYYSLQAVFAGVERADRPYTPDPGRTDGTTSPPLVFAATSQFSPIGAFTPSPTPREVHVLARGDVDSPLRLANPGALACITEPSAAFFDSDPARAANEGERRAALAKWLVDPRNPLTWRSIVNRVWGWHFGTPLAATANDFGAMGTPPTHPRLLDWLAREFRDGGGSLRALHRLIVTSEAYRRSSATTPELRARDPENRFLARMNRRRLDAEQVRDSLLSIAGRLDLRMGGPSDAHYGFRDDHSPVYDYGRFDPDSPSGFRRAIYRSIVRSVPDPFLDCLDFPDSCLSTPRRNVTITALQALAMQNDPFVLAQCRAFAARLEREVGADPTARIERAYVLTLGRAPSATERDALVEHARVHGLVAACRVLVNLTEFMFID